MVKPRSRMSRSASTNRWSSSGLNTTTSAPGGSAARGSRAKLAPRAHPASLASIESMILYTCRRPSPGTSQLTLPHW
jgi:hypothetical protein